MVESPDAVARRDFWPFVRYEKRTRRFDYRTGKPTVKARAVQYAAHLDANIFSYYTEQLATRYDARLESLGLSDHVTAYRPLGRSNVDMLAFDRCVAAEIETRGGFYRRYCDDILIALPARHAASFPLDAFLHQALAERRLPLNEKKTTCHHAVLDKHDAAPRIAPPVTYLGLTYDGERVHVAWCDPRAFPPPHAGGRQRRPSPCQNR